MRARAGSRRAVLLLLILLLPLAPGPAGAAGAERVILVLDGPLTARERTDLLMSGVVIEKEHAVADAVVARVPAVAAMGVPPQSRPYVLRVQPVEPLELHLDGSKSLIRAGTPTTSLGVTGRGVTVAVVDSGVDATHPDLAGRVLANVRLVNGRFVDSPGDANGHGTHVASIVAGSGAASGGALAGVAPGARIVGVDISGDFDTAAALEAFDWLFLNRERYDVRVVVAAWGRQARGERYDPSDALVRAADRLVREGIVVVFSASNHGPAEGTLSVEAQNPSVITVGATDKAGVLARYSSRGPAYDKDGAAAGWVKPDVVAPGTHVVAARSAASSAPSLLGDLAGDPLVGADALRYHELSGTSQAAPHVAGVVALMLEADRSLSPPRVMNILRETAIDLGRPGPDLEHGFGLVDARDAVLLALRRDPDRGNTLLRGGEESYRASGRFLGTENRGLQTSPSVKLADSGYADLAFAVKPGAERVDFAFTWSPGTAAFRVYLTNGARTLGPWSSAESAPGGGRVIRGGLDARDLEPGTWTLAARGTAATDVTYAAEAKVRLSGNPEFASTLDPRHRVRETPVPGVDGFWEAVAHELDVAGVRVQVALRRLAAWAGENPLAATGVAVGAAAGSLGLLAGPWLLRRRA